MPKKKEQNDNAFEAFVCTYRKDDDDGILATSGGAAAAPPPLQPFFWCESCECVLKQLRVCVCRVLFPVHLIFSLLHTYTLAKFPGFYKQHSTLSFTWLPLAFYHHFHAQENTHSLNLVLVHGLEPFAIHSLTLHWATR